MEASLLERAEHWTQHDPDPQTQGELRALLAAAQRGDAAKASELSERFAGMLEFGTAGLRGLLGGGDNRMNRAVVRKTTFGLGRYLLATVPDLARSRGVVIAYDGRILGRELAEDTASVLAALGIPAHLACRPWSTPELAFAVTDLAAAAGVMVTASHNPPQYNGYKVYWSNGAQIIPPHDHGIAQEIAKSPDADAVPLTPLAEGMKSGAITLFGDEVERRYLDAVRKLWVNQGGDRAMAIVYTPMHGTGNRPVRAAFAEAGFTNVTTVPEQAEPDGAFPTVAFPNPEEKGALDLAYAAADRAHANLIIANDPDVDRLALAVRAPSGKFVQLTGNQIGAILGHYLLTEGNVSLMTDMAKHAGLPYEATLAVNHVGHYLLTEGKDAGTDGRIVLASLVSSPMLGVIAKALGVRYEETLTGFKWIANRAIDLLKSEGLRFVFGFEEALGYTVGTNVRDKDGISAAVIAAELAALRAEQGKTLLDELELLSRRYGLFVSGQKSITLPGAQGLAEIGEIMRKLRANPPTKVGSHAIVATSDYQAQVRRTAVANHGR